VPRDGRPADRQRLGKLADGAVAGAEQLDDRAPIGIAEGLEGIARER